MKNILFALLLIFTSSCSTPDKEEYQPYFTGENSSNCGIIVVTGEDQRGDYIEVRMPGYSPIEKDRYKVNDYRNYQLNQKICTFDGLTKQPL